MKWVSWLLFAALAIGCSKKDNEPPKRGTFSGSWIENDTSAIRTIKGSLFKGNFKMVVLYSNPSPASTRNITFFLTDTLAGTYPIGLAGTGQTSVQMNGVNGPEGNLFFTSTSGTLTITEKYPTWISGEFEFLGNATSGSLEKVKGSFKYLPLR